MPLRLTTRRPTVLALAALLAASAAGCRASGEERAAAAEPPATTTGTAAANTAATSGATTAATATADGEAALAAPNDSVALRALADSGRIGGAPGAKVWLLMVSDFQCPYCKTWHDQSYEAIQREYVATGKVRVAYLHYPLDQHEQAMPAAEASMCASAQRKFWPYQTALFNSVDRWGKAGDQTAVYESLAQAQGLDLARFRSCMRSHVMRALIEADKDRMARAGVQSTPSFFVGNQGIAGAQPTAVFRRALDAALAAAPAR